MDCRGGRTRRLSPRPAESSDIVRQLVVVYVGFGDDEASDDDVSVSEL